MSWASLLAGLVSLFNKVAEHFARQQDRKAGADAEKLDRADAAREKEREMQDANTRAPGDAAGAAERLRDGKF
jgi:hypothetical protein